MVNRTFVYSIKAETKRQSVTFFNLNLKPTYSAHLWMTMRMLSVDLGLQVHFSKQVNSQMCGSYE